MIGLVRRVTDRALGQIARRGVRRGLAGEPLWLALGIGAWLLARERNQRSGLVWSGRLDPGDRLVIESTARGSPAASRRRRIWRKARGTDEAPPRQGA